jgi:hypothetical protein
MILPRHTNWGKFVVVWRLDVPFVSRNMKMVIPSDVMADIPCNVLEIRIISLVPIPKGYWRQ